MNRRMWINAMTFTMTVGMSMSSLAQTTSGPIIPTPSVPTPSAGMAPPATPGVAPASPMTPPPALRGTNSAGTAANATTIPGAVTTPLPPGSAAPSTAAANAGIGLPPGQIQTTPGGLTSQGRGGTCPCNITTPANRAPVGGCNC